MKEVDLYPEKLISGILSFSQAFVFLYQQITSQNPYAEDFIGKPYVYTIDIHNETEVENTIKDILISKVMSKLIN